ncbi:Uncharacterized protein APZ42_030612 [Daphnia magna]|uniref:Uncharacterized protein n=1 Tax=Daphnia magna TaxID=35525 RepID=A0A0P6B9D6_9CRUS|nr:Uncharacterized protein APZ42_030612 [Daphnia magna]
MESIKTDGKRRAVTKYLYQCGSSTYTNDIVISFVLIAYGRRLGRIEMKAYWFFRSCCLQGYYMSHH